MNASPDPAPRGRFRDLLDALHQLRNAFLALSLAFVLGVGASLWFVKWVALPEAVEAQAAAFEDGKRETARALQAIDSTHTAALSAMDSTHAGRMDSQDELIRGNRRMSVYLLCVRKKPEWQCADQLLKSERNNF